MKSKILTCAAASAISLVTAHAAIISVNFEARNGGGAIAPGDAAGVMAASNFNNISGYAPPDTAGAYASGWLNDSTGTPTPVAFNINANDSWSSGSGTTTPNATLLNGIIKAQNNDPGDVSTVPLNIFALTPGTPYTLAIYTTENGAGAQFNITDGVTTFYQEAQDGAAYGGAFILGNNTDGTPGVRPIANYVEFSGTVNAAGQINVLYNWEAGSDGTGISGFQLDATPIPEPSSLLLLGFAGAGIFIRRRR